MSTAWATLQHAVDTIAPGDTILVETGNYLGCRIGSSGTASAVKTLKADAGAHVVVTAPGPANKHNSNIEVENFSGTVSYWVIDGIESQNSPKYGIDIRVTSNITVQNCYTHNSVATGIFTAFSDHATLLNNQTAYNGEHGIYFSNSGTPDSNRGSVLIQRGGEPFQRERRDVDYQPRKVAGADV